MNSKIKEFVQTLDGAEKDELYRYLWVDYVKKDIASYCEDRNIACNEDIIDIAANLYVYDGEYDCELSYWDNIHNLVQMAIERKQTNAST